jgi:hypothetical protein
VTQATHYVLPMLYSKDRNDSFFITKNFKNCYIGDGNHPELGKKIFLLYNYQMSVEYIKFERKIELISEFSDDYDYGDERQVMYVFNVPEEHENDFKLFTDGKLSEFSDELKNKIKAFWGIKDDEPELLPELVLSREIYMNPN